MALSLPQTALGRLGPEARGILLTLVAMGLFGCMDGFSKLLVQDYPAWFILWIRQVLTLGLVVLILARRRPLTLLRSIRRPRLQLLRALMMAAEMGLVLIALRTLQLADIHAIFAATPLLVTALSGFFLAERVGAARWAAVLAGFVGMLVVLRPGLGVIQPGALLAALCMVMYAVYHVLTRLVSRTDPPEASYLAQTLIAAVSLSLVGPLFWTPVALGDVPLFLGLAILGTAGHYCLVQALAAAPAVVVQPFTYTLLLWAVGIGYLVFGDLPDFWTLLGAGIVVGAGVFAALQQRRDPA